MRPVLVVLLLLGFAHFSEEVKAMDAADPAAALVRGNNAFALGLYSRLAPGEGNRFFSPFSVSAALAMTYAGARGETATEMARTLHFDSPPEQIHAAFHQLLDELQRRSSPRPDTQDRDTDEDKVKAAPDVQLFTANALWAQAGERFLPEFLNLVEGQYHGGLYPVDFRNAAEEARQAINTWVEEQTRGKIKDLIKPGQVSTTTLLVLTNAIYFKALWARPFRAENTHPGDFHVSAREHVRVALMSQTDRFRYLDGGSFQVLELPYKGDALAMVIVLPRAVDGLPGFESALTAGKLEASLAKLSSQRVQVSLPRFQLAGEFGLAETLGELGMPSAFRLDRADFSGITGQRNIAISAVVHKAFIEVEERGTEAAAATGVVMARAEAIVAPPAVFRADHPFLFLIRDGRTGSILFLGRLVRPAA